MRYRRDISHILRLVGLLLLGLIVYQVWIKPSLFSPASRPATASLRTEPSPAALPAIPEHAAFHDVPQTRLIDPGASPSKELSSIQEDLERGHYHAVEATLSGLSKRTLATERAREFAAALWNNLGVQQEKYGGIEVSVKAFKRAVALAPNNPTALLNLTQAYWGLRDDGLTLEFLQNVIRVAPKDAFPQLALADLLIERGKQADAAVLLHEAEESAKHDPDLRSYFLRLTARLDRPLPPNSPSPEMLAAASASKTSAPPPQARTPSPVAPSPRLAPPASPKAAVTSVSAETPTASPLRTFTPRSREHFTIAVDGPPNADQSAQIRSILEYAYDEMSHKFGHMPTAPIRVVLHPAEKFVGQAGNPAWADSLYEAPAATIHLPMDGALDDLALLSRVARHQFAHALLHDKVGSRLTELPSWLAEGLAIYLAEDPWPELEDSKDQTGAVIPLSTLQASWSRLPKESWTVAYLESLVATQALIDQYSMYGVRQVVSAIQLGQPLDRAMQQKLAVSYGQFQQTWEQRYKAQSPSGRS